MATPAASIGRGALAGLAGGLAMTVSTNVEMRVRGRPPSDAPAKAIERLFGLDVEGQRSEQWLALGAHFVTSLSVGAAVGAARMRLNIAPARAGAALLAASLTPEIVVVPALSAADPPWRWSRADWTIAVLHHAVFAAAGAITLQRLG